MKTGNRRINYVDLLMAVVLISILVIFVSEIFRDSSRVDFTTKETVTLTLRVKDIPLKHSGLIRNGDTMYFADDEKELGKIKYVSYDSEKVEFLDKLTNASSIYNSPDRKTVLMLVDASAEKRQDGYYVSGKKISESNEIYAFVPAFSFTATVVNIENDKE